MCIRDRVSTQSTGGEESYKGGDYNLSNKPTWIVDPIDGTTNFVHRYPFVAVSIALSINKVIVVGVVYNPILHELFQAYKGGGAYLNDQPIQVSSNTTIPRSVVTTNFGYDRTEEGIAFMTSCLTSLLSKQIQSLRSGGSAACEMTSVACGRLDLYYEWGIHPWDIAAAALIITEAGGVVLDPHDGQEVDIETRRVLCGNASLAQHVVSALASVKIPEKWSQLKRKSGK
eukprot:TRINITY_DN613_c0_g1_i6.p1 TRINITY_DN613_c0_g1~~TRINITY_DN613_c0_g1_i6.p1  ORF type:complete len:229 (-),score=51.82 TRINITY_DN613_c0_g1_i6:53-739(-)